MKQGITMVIQVLNGNIKTKASLYNQLNIFPQRFKAFLMVRCYFGELPKAVLHHQSTEL